MVDTSLFIEEIQKRVAVSIGEINQFTQLWEYKKFKKNEIISSANEISQFSIFVLKGCLRQYEISEKGEEIIVYFAEERHFIGDLPSMRNRTPSIYYFQAIEACELLTISAENWKIAFEKYSWWVNAHIAGYQKWATLLQQQIAASNAKTGEERYLQLLKDRPRLFQRVPQHFIASYLGIYPETLSRIRKKLATN